MKRVFFIMFVIQKSWIYIRKTFLPMLEKSMLKVQPTQILKNYKEGKLTYNPA